MSSSAGLPLISVTAVAVLHLAAGRLDRGLERHPAWVSATHGLSVAYVFVHLIPELDAMQSLWLEATPDRPLPWLRLQVYLAALLGVLVTLALEPDTSGASRARSDDETRRRFWVQAGPFAVYNVLIGSFASRLANLASLLVAVLALGSHFLLTDRALLQLDPRTWQRRGRWLLAGSVLFGWVLGSWGLPELLTALLMALVAGTMIARSIKEELPDRRGGYFRAFVAGALVYSTLLVVLAYFRSGAEGVH